MVTNASSQPTGQILFEYWFDIGGTAVSDLTSDPDYPDKPDDFEWRDRYEGPVDWQDNYGSRARGYVYPPADGDYTFWISGDDYEELYLSTDDDPANATLIAEVPGWTQHLEWGKYPEQQSDPITLVGGQKYYIESIMKEGGGGDSMTVAWAGPEIGEELTIIDGAFLSPWLIFTARLPSPADGAVDVVDFTLEWAPGDTAVMSQVYISTDDVIDANDLAVETDLAIYLPTLELGTEYYWRVDSVDAEGNVFEGPLWSFTTIPLEAHFPSPEDGAEWVPLDAQLSWTAGKDAIMHDLYLGTDQAAVAAADPSTFMGKLMETSFDPGPLEPDTVYYWKVDEFALGVTNPGPVWSFKTLDPEVAMDPMPADGAENVSDRLTLSWMVTDQAVTHDVYLGTDMDAVVAGDPGVLQGTVEEPMFTPPAPLEWDTVYYWKVDVNTADTKLHPARYIWSFKVADYLILDDGLTTLDYDNTVEPFVSEVMWDTPEDFTLNGIRDLSLMFQGRPAPEGSSSIDDVNGVYEITGSGNDIWGTADAFHYVYRELTGDAVITVRVVDNGEGSNAWAKGGPMIRQSLEPGALNVMGAVTGGNGNGGTFQWRPVKDDSSSSSRTLTDIAPPYYVRLIREGDTFTVQMSPDGVNFEQQGENPVTIEMTDPVLIGLAVTSHAAGEKRTFTFDELTIEGEVGADEMSTDVGIPSNSAEALYAVLEDNSGAMAMAVHPNPAATQIDQWWKWKIPLSDFAGVDLTDVNTLTIGVGDGEPGGTGSVDIQQIRVVKPVVVKQTGDITMPGDNVKGVPDDGDWPGAEHPALAVDDDVNTKYLHFKGEEQPTGIKITPAAKQVVTGITFTTANDAPERDPNTFELYGSNEGIDGPYEMIASGVIVDFNDPNEAWPRFTMNTTPITFDNATAYDHYQILFPTVRDAASANSMQIAEIELITEAPFESDADTLDGWSHDNKIDMWDGTAPGEGNPGGVGVITEDDTTYIRVQDTGDPRDYADNLPFFQTNYSLYLTQPVGTPGLGLDGARIEIRARIATTGTLDAWRKDGGGLNITGLFDWPAGGLGGAFENGSFENYGRGNINLSAKGEGVIGLVMSTSGLLVGNKGNKVAVDDAADWNTFVINIADNGGGKYKVSVSANGEPDKSFTVTPGTGVVEDGTTIAIGSPDLAGRVATGFDIDYISVVW
jgi:hypothetical protein